MNGIETIAEERRRQVTGEGFTDENDDKYVLGELLSAAVCYTVAADCLANSPDKETTDAIMSEIKHCEFGPAVAWPWPYKWLKIHPDPVRNLAKAGALIAAEIDRLNRRAERR